MPTSLAELAALVQGRVIGNGGTLIAGAGTLHDVGPGQITFLDQAEKLPLLARSPAVAAVVPPGVAPPSLPAIEVDNVYDAFAAIVGHFRPARSSGRRGISPQALISASARLGMDVTVHPGATIGDDVEVGARSIIHSGAHLMAGCKLSEDVTVFPGAVLYEGTLVGPRCLIHAAAVLGAYGFGYKLVEGRHRLAAQLGYVELGPDVEIGAGTTIDRGSFGATYVGEGTKIDDQVMIGHNCRIGRHNLIVSQVGIAGSTTTGDYVVMGGQAGIRDHVHIGDRAMLSAMAGVTADVPAGVSVMGIPATPEREQKVKQAALSKLPEMRRQLKALERTVAELAAREGKKAA